MSEAFPATIRVSAEVRRQLWALKYSQQQETGQTVSINAIIERLLADRKAAAK